MDATDAPARPVARSRWRPRTRVVRVTLGLSLACLAVLCLTLSLGEVDVSPLEVLRALAGTGEAGTAYIVTELRLPRSLVALLAGAAFGLSGAIFQALLRNPLASPDIIGITAGASAAAVYALLVVGITGFAVSASAFGGALATAAAIYLISWRRGVTGYRMILAGIAMAAMLTSVVSYCLTTSDVHDAGQALVWLTGSLNAKTWASVELLGPVLAVLLPAALLAGRWFRVLELGDDLASGLGLAVERSRVVLLVLAVALAATATAAVGPVALFAFMCGPIAQRLTGAGIALLPSALVGATLLTAADLVAQHAVQTQFPVGIVTSLLGAPYLLWLLARTNRS